MVTGFFLGVDENAPLRADVHAMQRVRWYERVITGMENRALVVHDHRHFPLHHLEGQGVGVEVDRVIEIRLITANNHAAKTVI